VPNTIRPTTHKHCAATYHRETRNPYDHRGRSHRFRDPLILPPQAHSNRHPNRPITLASACRALNSSRKRYRSQRGRAGRFTARTRRSSQSQNGMLRSAGLRASAGPRVPTASRSKSGQLIAALSCINPCAPVDGQAQPPRPLVAVKQVPVAVGRGVESSADQRPNVETRKRESSSTPASAHRPI
jgi:hypothetical protein